MDRFENFSATFIITLLAYLIFGFIPYVDSIVVAVFMYSIFFFIFTKEEKIKTEKLLKEPRVHFYHKSRNNMHGYLLVGGATVSILLFYFLSFNLDFRIGVAALTTWFLMILYSIWANNYMMKFAILDTVVDFMYIALNKKIEIEKLDKLVARYFYLEFSHIKDKVLADKEIAEDLKEKFYSSLIIYIKQNFIENNELTSKEIESMVENTK